MLLDDGTMYPADLVVMAAGIRPETRIATDARLHVERGVVVDDQMRTSDPEIFAVGECVEHDARCYGFVEPLYEMAAVAAKTLARVEAAFRSAQTATRLKVTGVDVFSAGDFTSALGNEEIILSDPGGPIYKKLVVRHGRLIGAVLFGDIADGPWYFDLMRSGQPIADIRDGLAFGRSVALREAA